MRFLSIVLVIAVPGVGLWVSFQNGSLSKERLWLFKQQFAQQLTTFLKVGIPSKKPPSLKTVVKRSRKRGHQKRRGVIPLSHYRKAHSQHSQKQDFDLDPYHQSRIAFLLAELGMTERQLKAFELAQKRHVAKITHIILKSDPEALDTIEIRRIVELNDFRDAWLRRRLSPDQYEKLLLFEEELFIDGNRGLEGVSSL